MIEGNFKNYFKSRFVRYDNLRAFEKHLEGATPHHLSPLYVIAGKEDYECKEATQLLLNFLVPAAQQDLALKVWDGTSVNEGELITDLYSQSFFTDKRVILIKNVDKLKKSVQEELEKYIKKISRSQHLILCTSTLVRNSNFYKLLEKEGIVLDFAELKPWDKEKRLIEWLGKKIANVRKLMPYQVCQKFVKQVGMDQHAIANELDKLLCYIGERQEITWQDVENICTLTSSESIWQMGEAIFSRNTVLSLKIIKNLLLEGQPFLQLLRQIRSQFATELQISMLLSQNKTPSEITQVFPYMKGQILEKHITYVKQYGSASFRQGLIEIDAIESNIKNTQIDEQLLAELLIYKLTR